MPSVLLLDFDLTKTLKAEHLEIPSSPLRVTLDVDKALLKAMQDDPLIHQQLADAGIDVLQANRAKVQKEIEAWDRKLGEAHDKKDLDEANKGLKELCTQLAKQSEKDARDAVEKQWKTIQGRQ